MTNRRYPSTLEGQKVGPDAWRTISYTSEPVGRALGFVMVFGVLAFFLLCLAIGIVWLADLDAMWALILFALFGLLGFLALIPQHYRHSQEGIDLAKIRSDERQGLARTNADYGVQVTHANALIMQTENQRMLIERGKEKVLSQPAQSDRNRLSTYVAPEPDDDAEEGARPSYWAQPLRRDAMTKVMTVWAGEVYKQVRPDGRINGQVPWSERGTLSKVDAERAQGWLRNAAHMQGTGWIVEYRNRRKAWYLNLESYPEPADLLSALGATSPPRGGDDE